MHQGKMHQLLIKEDNHNHNFQEIKHMVKRLKQLEVDLVMSAHHLKSTNLLMNFKILHVFSNLIQNLF